MPLHRIIYASKTEDIRKDDLESILGACERNNPIQAVTGMLLFDNGYFLQVLEGSRMAVSSTFLRLVSDPRHSQIQILTSGPIDARLFSNWSMHHVVVHGAGAVILKRYLSGAVFNPLDMSAASVEHLCLDFAAHAARVAIEKSLDGG